MCTIPLCAPLCALEIFSCPFHSSFPFRPPKQSTARAKDDAASAEDKTNAPPAKPAKPASFQGFDTWFTWCQQCSHGGHAKHLSTWFEHHAECPVAGCDCHCNVMRAKVSSAVSA